MRRLIWSKVSDRDKLHALRSRTVSDVDIEASVAKIIAEVTRHGDAAIREYTARFDRVTVTDLELSSERWDALDAACDPELRRVLVSAADRIRAFHRPQKGRSYRVGECRQEVRPLDRVGLYVPGGRARYPSTVLMLGIPAAIAGVREVVLVTPPGPGGTIDPAVAAAARIAGVNRIFTIGGAQAVAALAYGTGAVPKVDRIVGPGNAWVAAAKRQLSGVVGVDLDAGPSEVLVVADDSARADWVARDLIAQAEHDPKAVCVLLATSDTLLDAVDAEVTKLLALEPNPVAKEALDAAGALVRCDEARLAEAIDAFAPEHLELEVADPEALLAKIRNAGAVFLGGLSPAPLGDYLAGPNHTLPTSGSARFQSGLGVDAFEKRVNVVAFDSAALARHGADVARFARAEGLVGHARAVEVRLAEAGEGTRPDVASYAKDAVRRQHAYTLKAPVDAPVKLNQNEAPEDLPPDVKALVIERLMAAPWNRYPPFDPTPLRERLAAIWGWRADGILVGNGSNDLIKLLFQGVVRPGDRVVVPEPCFSLYPLHLDANEAVLDRVAVTRAGYDVDALVEKARGARLVVLGAPNNPTATELPREVLPRLLESGALVCLDEAYAEFQGWTAIPDLGPDVPLVILRTMSKAWGMAAARFGALLGPPRLLAELAKVQLPYGVNVLTQTVASVVLDREDLVAARVPAVLAERRRLEGALRERGFDPWPSAANFLLVPTAPRDPTALFQALLARGVLVRDVSGAVPGHLRINAGTPEQGDALLAALDAALAETA
jgi:histidinol dehydrogenase